LTLRLSAQAPVVVRALHITEQLQLSDYRVDLAEEKLAKLRLKPSSCSPGRAGTLPASWECVALRPSASSPFCRQGAGAPRIGLP